MKTVRVALPLLVVELLVERAAKERRRLADEIAVLVERSVTPPEPAPSDRGEAA
jgi:hypothetical protein